MLLIRGCKVMLLERVLYKIVQFFASLTISDIVVRYVHQRVHVPFRDWVPGLLDKAALDFRGYHLSWSLLHLPQRSPIPCQRLPWKGRLARETHEVGYRRGQLAEAHGLGYTHIAWHMRRKDDEQRHVE